MYTVWCDWLESFRKIHLKNCTKYGIQSITRDSAGAVKTWRDGNFGTIANALVA